MPRSPEKGQAVVPPDQLNTSQVQMGVGDEEKRVWVCKHSTAWRGRGAGRGHVGTDTLALVLVRPAAVEDQHSGGERAGEESENTLKKKKSCGTSRACRCSGRLTLAAMRR